MCQLRTDMLLVEDDVLLLPLALVDGTCAHTEER